MTGKAGQDGRLIAGPGAGLEHDVPRLDPGQVAHQGDDERLGNVLPVSQGQRHVLIGQDAQGFGHKFVATHLAHCFQDAGVNAFDPGFPAAGFGHGGDMGHQLGAHGGEVETRFLGGDPAQKEHEDQKRDQHEGQNQELAHGKP